MSDNVNEESGKTTSRYVTVFHQLKESETGEPGDRFLALGEHHEDRHKYDEELEDFVPLARPIAVIDAGAEIAEDGLEKWCNSHAGQAVLSRYFDVSEPDDPTLPDVGEYVEAEA
jgi:hypothetical protein